MLQDVSGSPAAQLPLGLPALFDELRDQSITPAQVYKAAGIKRPTAPRTLDASELLALFKAVRRLAPRPDTALRAGRRQKVENFGVYGFALVTSNTFGDAFRFGLENLALAGAVMRITFERRGKVGVLRTHSPGALGDTLPFIAEFWRSSMTTLMSDILGDRFPSVAMYFPYAQPRHALAYRQTFGCPVHFDSDAMEWHFDAKVLSAPCPKADAVTSLACRDFCERVVSGGEGQSSLQRQVRGLCLTRPVGTATATVVAAELGLSLRSFYRRLAEEGVTFQTLLDETWRSIAIEYLTNTTLSVDQIADRCGYGDPSNFRKAFRRWTGAAPTAFRPRKTRTTMIPTLR